MSDPQQPHGLQPTRLLCSRDSPGKSTRVGCHTLLQGIFLTQRSNLCLLHLPVLTHGFFATSATWETPVTVSLNSKFFHILQLSGKFFPNFIYFIYIYIYIYPDCSLFILISFSSSDLLLLTYRDSLVAQMVENLHEMQETQVQFLVQ